MNDLTSADGPAADEPSEAVEIPPWREGDAHKPEIQVYRTGEKPILAVFAAGQWRTAVVREKHLYKSFSPPVTAYRVMVDLGEGYAVRTYRWPSSGLRLRFIPATSGSAHAAAAPAG